MAVMEMPLVPTERWQEPDLPSREDVVARWVAGDGDALRLAFDGWGAAIHAYCHRRLGPEDAADATQEVFVGAWRARTQYDPSRGVFAQWLFGIARNTCVTFHRRRARLPEPVAEPRGDDATGGAEEVPDQLLLAGALAQLPDRQRRVVMASFIEGWTNVEVADRLALPLGTVKSDIRRGLRTLREHLGDTR